MKPSARHCVATRVPEDSGNEGNGRQGVPQAVPMLVCHVVLTCILGLALFSSSTQKLAYAGGEEEVVEAEAGGESVEESETPPEESDKPPAETKPSDDETAQPADGGQKRVIGATARIQEGQSGFIFTARVDTGAKSCSIHVDELRIENEVEDMEQNVGKTVKFTLRDENNKTYVCNAKIKQVVRIKNANGNERRYKVPMELSWKNKKKNVLVTLNDRAGMEYPLLIGRNFLKGDFLVDVEVDDAD